jgi:hypothetical protein
MYDAALVLKAAQTLKSHDRSIKPWMLGLVLLSGLWLYGLVSFVAADGHIEIILPRRRSPPAEFHNFSLWDQGPTLRASSFYSDWSSHHHPAFLIDGRASPSLVEKWASAKQDPHPWIEVTWRESHDLARVVLRHAGTVEPSDFTVHRYTIHCLSADGQGPSLDVPSNKDAVAIHELSCPRARGIHITFKPNSSGEIVRLYELETWGL